MMATLAPLQYGLAEEDFRNGSLDFEQRINGKVVLGTVEPVRQRLQELSAVFFSGHDVVAYGVILTPDGYIATKASELKSHKDLMLRIGADRYEHFQIIGSDPVTDMLLIKVDVMNLPAPGPITGEAPLGTIVVSNGSTTRMLRRAQLGVISSLSRPIPNDDQAYVGVIFSNPATLKEVIKNSPADQAGAMAGDQVLSLDGSPVSTLEAMSPILSKKQIGDQLVVKVKRAHKTLSYTINLGSRRKFTGERTPQTSNDLISGGFSTRRDDFPMVLQHDTPSRYTMMGGPLLNLKGELLGMNMARVNRAENYALPIHLVQESMRRILKQEGTPEDRDKQQKE